MRTDLSFSVPKRLHVEAIAFESGGVAILASTEVPAARCPECGYPSRRVHSRYRRTLTDLPWAGVPVRLRVTARKLFCDNPRCRRRVFAERQRERWRISGSLWAAVPGRDWPHSWGSGRAATRCCAACGASPCTSITESAPEP